MVNIWSVLNNRKDSFLSGRFCKQGYAFKKLECASSHRKPEFRATALQNPGISQLNPYKNRKKRKSLQLLKARMQRLTNWFEDHLPLRRRSVSRSTDSRTNNTQNDYLTSFKAGLAQPSKPKNHAISTSVHADYNRFADIQINRQQFQRNAPMWQSMMANPSKNYLQNDLRSAMLLTSQNSGYYQQNLSNKLKNGKNICETKMLSRSSLTASMNANQYCQKGNYYWMDPNESSSSSEEECCNVLNDPLISYSNQPDFGGKEEEEYLVVTTTNATNEPTNYLKRPVHLFDSKLSESKHYCLYKNGFDPMEQQQLTTSYNSKLNFTYGSDNYNSVKQPFNQFNTGTVGANRRKIRTNPWINTTKSNTNSLRYCNTNHNQDDSYISLKTATTKPRCFKQYSAKTIRNGVTPSLYYNSINNCETTTNQSMSGTGSGSSIASITNSIEQNNNNTEPIKELSGKLLNSSTCSSGYGSHDSSPECSVHSPDWLPNNVLLATSTNNSNKSDKNLCSTHSSNSIVSGIDATGGITKYESDISLKLAGVMSNTGLICSSVSPPPQQTAGLYSTKNKLNSNHSDDEHIYYELEEGSTALQTNPKRITSINFSCQANLSGEFQRDTSASPIYAVPHQHNIWMQNVAKASINTEQRCSHQQNVQYQQRQNEKSIKFQQINCCRRTNASTQHCTLTEASNFACSTSSSDNESEEDVDKPIVETANNYFLRMDEDRMSSVSSTSTTTSCSSWTPMMKLSAANDKIDNLKWNESNTNHGNSNQDFFHTNHTRLHNNNEVDLLAELEQQISELQQQSNAVRNLVEQAKERHEIRSRTRQLCMQHLRELRKMRWIMHRNFEICL